MIARRYFRLLAIAVLAGWEAFPSDTGMRFSDAANTAPTQVKVTVNRPGESITVPVTIPAQASAQRKRDGILLALDRAGYNVEGNGANGLTIKGLESSSSVTFEPGETGETDVVQAPGVPYGEFGFQNVFDPFDSYRQPAIFTAGIVTDVGELAVQVSAQELNFQTEGPIICQALFQRLAPRAPQFGAQINYAGDRLEIYFDPAYTVSAGGVIFGTTSLSAGAYGAVVAGPDCDDGCQGQ